MVHVWFAITPHGFGHAGQAIRVIEALRAAWPDLRLTIEGDLPPDLLASRLAPPYELVSGPGDFGLVMTGPVDVDVAASRAAWSAVDQNWDQLVTSRAQRLALARPDVVVSNISALALAAARQAGVPAVALGCLNWADILPAYLGLVPVVKRLEAAYAGADLYIQTVPHMPMDSLPRRVVVGPLGRRGGGDPAAVRRDAGAEDKLIAVSLGGRREAPPVAAWPHRPDWRLVVPAGIGDHRPDVVTFEALHRAGHDFSTIVAACDGFLGKAGYGTAVEVAVNRTPMVLIRRPDWPEEPHVLGWLGRVGRWAEVSRAAMEAGDVADAMADLWARPAPPAVDPTGAGEAVAHLARLLGR